MMPAISAVMLAVGSSPAASIVAKATVTTALGLIAAWLARGNRAAVRHALLAAMFGAMLVLPLASAVMPPLHVGLPGGVGNRATLPLLTTVVDGNPSVAAMGAGTRVASVAPHASKLSLSNLLLAGWAAGAAIFLLRAAIGLWQIRSLRRSGLPWRRGQPVVEALALDTGIHRHVQVLLHEALPGPMTCGVVHPAIVLPTDAENWERDDLNRAIVHELEHVRRGDCATRCLARVACAVYWFHPLVWIGWRKLALEAERSCDDAVLRRSEATAYADQLVGLARRISRDRRSPLLAMANRDDLATRVGAVLDGRQQRGRAGTFSVVLAGAIAAALAIAISPLVVVAAPQAGAATVPSAPSQGSPLAFDVASVKPNKSDAPSSMNFPLNASDLYRANGLFSATNLPLFTYIVFAYKLAGNGIHFLVPQLPGWVMTERFDIQARATGEPSKDQMRLMMRSLLAERFKFASHTENRDVPVLAFALANPGKTGPQLQPHPAGEPCHSDLDPTAAANPAADMFSQIPGGFPAICNGILGIPPSVPGRSRLGGRNVTIGFMADMLSQMVDLGRPMIDASGLTGAFDFLLEFTRDSRAQVLTQLGVDTAPDPDGPSFEQALREQLGLKLDRRTGSMQVMVLDRVERPTAN